MALVDARWLGERAVRCARPADVRGGLAARLLVDVLRTPDEVADVVVTEEHVAVVLARPATLDDVRAWIARAAEEARHAPDAEPRVHVFEAVWDGEDLDDVARFASMSREEVVRLHAARAYEVKMIGFLPGFAYLGDVDARIAIPRRATPRPRVAAESLAIGASYTAVYPFASPGGWNVIGRVPGFTARAFELALGDRVRFEEG